jgi:hypothetical protein
MTLPFLSPAPGLPFKLLYYKKTLDSNPFSRAEGLPRREAERVKQSRKSIFMHRNLLELLTLKFAKTDYFTPSHPRLEA